MARFRYTAVLVLLLLGCAEVPQPVASPTAVVLDARAGAHQHEREHDHQQDHPHAPPAPRMTVHPDEGARTLRLRIGPIDLPAGDSHEMARTPLLAARLPVGGFLTGFDFELRTEAGEILPPALLHHVNLMVPDRVELFRPIMQRLVAAGKETGAINLPWPLGISGPQGQEILGYAMLHNRGGEVAGPVWLDMVVRYSERRRRPVQPFFIDVSPPPGPASWDLPPGPSERSWEGSPQVDGRILGVGGHLHRYGTELIFEDVTAGKVLTRLKPDVAPDGSIRAVDRRRFIWRRGIPLRTDHTYRITAVYHNPTPDTIPSGAMGAIGGIFMPRDRDWPRPDPEHPFYVRDLGGLVKFEAHAH
jgi:hypothetical protein